MVMSVEDINIVVFLAEDIINEEWNNREEAIIWDLQLIRIHTIVKQNIYILFKHKPDEKV